MATVFTAIRAGRKSAFALMAGLILGDVIYASFAIFGLSAVAHILGSAFVWVRLLSGIYLIYLGLKAFTYQTRQDCDYSGPQKGNERSFWMGLLVTLGNPKVILFYLGFLPAFFDLHRIGVSVFVQIVGVILLVSTLILGLYIELAQRVTRGLKNSRFHLWINRLAGGLMIIAGIKVAAN